MDTEKHYPSDMDPAGTRYVRDEDGEIIHDRRATSKSRQALLWFAMGLICLTSVLSLVGTIQQGHNADVQKHDAAKTDYDIRASQRNLCESSSNTLRDQVRDEFVDLKRKVLIPVFKQVRNTIPPRFPSYTILDNAVHTLKIRIKTIKQRIPDANCAAQYPLLDNPDTKRDETGQ